MSRDSILARGRAAAEDGMVDTCTIRRQTGSTTDPDSGATTPTYATQYEGKCRVQQSVSGAQAQQAEAGEDFQLLQRVEVQLPMSVTDLHIGDEIVIDTSVHDEDLPGTVFRVRDLAHGTHKTARRVGCIEVTT